MLQARLSKCFRGFSTSSDRAFSLQIQFKVRGGITVLFGASGCGKSSTLRAIAGLLRPDSGYIRLNDTIFFDSQQKIHLPPPQRQVGYVFQDYALFPHLNVKENIGFALNRQSKEFRRQRVTELLHLLELEDLAHFPIQRLSGGQAQRVALARALAPYPKILLLDEPFSALDYQLRDNLRRELQIIQRQFKLPVVLVTHSRADALELADTLVMLKDGKVHRIGQASILLDSRSFSLPRNFQWG